MAITSRVRRFAFTALADASTDKASKPDAVLSVLLCMSLSANVFLAQSAIRPAPSRGRPELVAIGADAPALSVKTLDGNETTISTTDQRRPTVLYIISPSCVWCQRNVANIRTVAAAMKESHRFVAVSLGDAAPEAFQNMNLGFDVYVHPSLQTTRQYGLSATPHTFVISADGKIVKSWSGAFASKTAADVENFFNVHLPGLVTVPLRTELEGPH